MGTKIKRRILLLFIIFIPFFLQAQDVKNVKKYAFFKCLKFNYQKIDTNFWDNYRDASGIMISLDGSFFENPKFQDKIIDFVDKETVDFHSNEISLHLETGYKNIVFCRCLDFYESKLLDRFIRKLLKENKRKT